MVEKRSCDEPLSAVAVDGEVHVTGGCGVHVVLTAPAALHSGDAIHDSAAAAFAQERQDAMGQAGDEAAVQPGPGARVII